VQVQEALRQASQLYQTKSPVDFDKAYQSLTELLSGLPDDPEVLNNLAYLLVGPDAPPGREKEALTYSAKSFELLSRSGPVNPYVADTHGWVLILNNQVDEGIRILEEVLARKEFAEAYLHIGEGYLRKKAAQQALSSLKRGREVLERPENQVPGSDVATLRVRIDDAIARAQAMVDATGGGGGN
jgi:tetratricopeptide (TPR) repeat protein